MLRARCSDAAVLAGPAARHPAVPDRAVGLRGRSWPGGRVRSAADLLAVGLGHPRAARTTRTCPSCSAWATRPTARIGLYTALGLFFLSPCRRWCGAAPCSGRLGRALLTGVAELRDQDHRRWRTARRPDAAVSAEATALRRLERDIHDGPQQRLVRLAMDLGRAQQQLDSDPEAARRAPRRGAHPDPGDARRAAGAVPRHRAADPGRPGPARRAGRARRPRLPDRPGRPGPRHPGRAARPGGREHRLLRGGRGADQRRQAQRGHRVPGSAVRPDDGAQLQVRGRRRRAGGAHLAKGHGLAGLADRVQAAGGELVVEQPDRRPDRDPRRAAAVTSAPRRAVRRPTW